MKYIIYKATNKLNGKCYIGQTSYPLRVRINHHLFRARNSGFYFHLALKKHGKENFKFEILKECKSFDEANRSERFFISRFNSLFSRGYNLTTGGESGSHSERTKKLLSKLNSGKNNPRYGKRVSEETRLKMSLAHKGKTWKLSREAKEKACEQRKKEWQRPGYREKMIEIHKGKPSSRRGKELSQEHKNNLSKAQKLRYKNHPDSEQTKINKSRAIKKWWFERKREEPQCAKLIF